MGHVSDRVVVTCLDEVGRWRPAALRVIASTSGGGFGEGREVGNNGVEDQLALEYLDDLAGAVPIDSGVVTGGFTDWHVHLHLIDFSALDGSPITRVHDLGGTPSELQQIAAGRLASKAADGSSGLAEGAAKLGPVGTTEGHGESRAFGSPRTRRLEVLYAGAFLTPPGGYPSDRSWAPASSYREVYGPDDAEVAVREMAAAGASAIKIASNSGAGPVFSDAVFEAIVSAARAAGLPVMAHAEGRGEAMRAARLGATRLAHAPFSELLTDDEVAELAARTSWCSTLDIHGWGDYGRAHETAVANVSAFVRHGGQLLYGTDMGNGPTLIGLNPRELASLTAAGLTPEQQIRALTPGDPRSPNAALLWIPRNDKCRLDVAAARRLHASDLAMLDD